MAFEPAGLAADGDGAFLNAAMGFVEIDEAVEAIGGMLDFGSERRLVGLDGEDMLRRNLDGDLQFHRVSRAVSSTKDRSDSS
ncbi:MAG: hypothetical protein E5V27_16735 [Mesorhizobium sp.]|nr:MAG: hypothetical protein E5V27_16735 [Mesorhizobium sp.]